MRLKLPTLRDALDHRTDADEDGASPRSQPVAAFRRGCKGGVIATAVMTLYRLPAFRALPPTAEFWAQYVAGGEAEDHFLASWVLHFLYGTVGGGVFGVGFARLGDGATQDHELLGVVSGLAYGVALSVFGTRAVLRHVLDRDLDTRHRVVFHVGHVIYGLTLGTWLGSRERVGEAYDAAEKR